MICAKNNLINMQQWNTILAAFYHHCEADGVGEDEIYVKSVEFFKGSLHKCRYFIHDNYDRLSSPGLRFITDVGDESGRLYVYNPSEQACAPITFEEGVEIAENFFTYEGYMMSERIVCNYMMAE